MTFADAYTSYINGLLEKGYAESCDPNAETDWSVEPTNVDVPLTDLEVKGSSANVNIFNTDLFPFMHPVAVNPTRFCERLLRATARAHQITALWKTSIQAKFGQNFKFRSSVEHQSLLIHNIN